MRKGEKKARVCKRSSFGVILSHFLLLRGQATWKGRFEGAKVRKIKTLTSFFFIWILVKSPNLREKGFLLILNHIWSCFGWIPWWIFDMGRIGEGLWKENE